MAHALSNLCVLACALGGMLLTPFSASGQSEGSGPPVPYLQTGHSAEVTSLAVSADGAVLASGSVDRSVRAWDLASGNLLEICSGHQGTVRSVALSSDGSTLFSSGDDRTIRIWDVATGALRKTITGYSTSSLATFALSMSADGKTLVAALQAGDVILLDPSTGAIKASVKIASFMAACAVSADGTRVAFAAADNSIHVHALPSGQAVCAMTGHGSLVTRLCFSPDGRLLASASLDKTVKLWDPASGTLQRSFEQHTAGVVALCFTPAGDTIGSSGYDGKVILWNPLTGETKSALVVRPTPRALVFGRDGTLCCACADGSIAVTDPGVSTVVRTLGPGPAPVRTVTFGPYSSLFACAGRPGATDLWDCFTGKLLRVVRGDEKAIVNSARFSLDGGTLITGDSQKSVRAWNAGQNRLSWSQAVQTGEVTAVAVSPTGYLLAAGGKDKAVRLWSRQDGRLLATCEGHTGEVTSVAIRLGGTQLASGSADKTVRLWETSSGKLLATLEGHRGAVAAVAYSPDGQRLASGGADGVLIVWNAGTQQQEWNVTTAPAAVRSIAFSGTGRYLAAGSADGLVRVWDLQTGKLFRTLEGNTADINDVDFSRDTRLLAAATGDGSVKLWSFRTGQLLCAFLTMGDETSMAVTRDGYIAGSDGLGKYVTYRAGSQVARPDAQQLAALEARGEAALAQRLRGMTLGIDAVSPDACMPEATTDITIRGVGFTEGARIALLAGDPSQAGFMALADATAFTLQGSIAYVIRRAGLSIVDMRDTASPAILGELPVESACTDVCVAGGYAYLAAGKQGLLVVDVHDPKRPTVVTSFVQADMNALTVTVSGSSLYVSDGMLALDILDISSPDAPRMVGTFRHYTLSTAMAPAGTRLYVLDAGLGFCALDLNDPAAPKRIGFCCMAGVPAGVIVEGTFAYCIDSVSGVSVYDIRDPRKPTPISSFAQVTSPSSLSLSGSELVVAGGEGITVLDVHDPSAPTLAGLIPWTRPLKSLHTANGCAYALDSIGLHVFRLPAIVTNVRLTDARTLHGTIPEGLTPGLYHLLVSNSDGEKGTLSNGVLATSPLPIHSTTDIDPDSLLFYRSNGTAVQFARTAYGFVSLIHGNLAAPPSLDTSLRTLMLAIADAPGFKETLAVSLLDAPRQGDFFKAVLDDAQAQRGDDPQHAIHYYLNTAQPLQPAELAVSRAGAGVLLLGAGPGARPARQLSVLCYLQSSDGKNMLQLKGTISVSPGHAVYFDDEEIGRYLLDFKVLMLTAQFMH